MWNLCCLHVDKYQKTYFVLVKGPSCFIFSNKNSPSPEYAINLEKKNAKLHKAHKKETHVLVTLENGLGDVEFQFIFGDTKSATTFTNIVQEQGAVANQNMVKQRLGHHNQINVRASTTYAAAVASEKEQDQPEKPIGVSEYLNVMPQVVY